MSTIAKTLIGAAAVSLLFELSAYAQQTASIAVPGSNAASPDQLEEIIITATRVADTVHNVPLTVSVVSSADIQEEGLKRVEDLAREVPALRITGSNSGAGGNTSGGGNVSPSVAIRGITSAVVGAASTTGIYIDDVPLQLRTLNAGGGGTALPLLFDLARVEVLKGPQGTLYGGSSEGGTLRFITEQPSFDTSALSAQVEGSSTKGGDANYEYGVSGGAPLVADTLAVHVSGLFRHDGGYLDHVSQFTGDTIASNTNDANHEAVHAIVDFKITDHFLASVSYLWQYEDYSDYDNYWLNVPQYQATSGPAPAPTLYTYGPYNMFGPFRSGANTDIGQNFYTSDAQLKPTLMPHSQGMSIPSVTLDYEFPWFDVKSVTAYARTRNHAIVNAAELDTAAQAGGGLGPVNQLPANSPFIANVPLYSSLVYASSDIGTTSEELRFTSAAGVSGLSWVAGLFYDRTNSTEGTTEVSNFADLQAATIAGVSQTTAPGTSLTEPTSLKETQKAIYGELNYVMFDHLKATAGLRYTKDTLDYVSELGGSLFGLPPGLLFPGYSGQLTSSATTPKFGLQYIVDPNTNYYLTVAEGYRPGGLNPVLSPFCQGRAAQLGYGNLPSTFSDDKLWSYELGTKLRPWDGRASINVSAFYINWKNVQTDITNALNCGQMPAINAGKEISKGLEFDGSVLVLPGLTATLRFGYTDAYYAKAVTSPDGAVTLINDGDRVLYSPKTQGDLGAEYRFNVGDLKAFVRADWAYQGSVATSYSAGTVSYVPDQTSLPAAGFGNARIGVDIGKLEVSAFVNNITNSEDLLYRSGFLGVSGPGPVNCFNAACTAYRAYAEGGIASTYTPRTIGVDVWFRY